MKRLLACAFALGLCGPAFPQQNPNTLLARLPDPPADACDLTSRSRSIYLKQIDAVARDLNAALAQMKRDQNRNVQQNQDAWRDQMVAQSGLTPEQIAKLKSQSQNRRNLTAEQRRQAAADRRAMADQALQQRTNLSLDEVQKLKDMDPAARQAWGQAYAAEATAVAQAQNQDPAQQAANQSDRERLAQLDRISREQKELLEKTTADRQFLTEKMRDLDDKANQWEERTIGPIQKRLEDVKAEIRRESDKLSALLPADGTDERAAKIRSLEDRINELGRIARGIELEVDNARRELCATFTPSYCDLLRRYRAWAISAQDGYAKYEELENERFKLQTNTPANRLVTTPGALGMEEAKACVDLLRSAYKYARHDPTRPADGGPRPDVGAAP